MTDTPEWTNVALVALFLAWFAFMEWMEGRKK